MKEPTPIRPVRRLVVELNLRTAQLLDDLVKQEGLNKTTLVNRAVQVYSLIIGVQTAGGIVYIQEAGSDSLQRLTIL